MEEPHEKRRLQMFIEYAAAKTSNWRFWKYHFENPNPERFHKHREMMAIAQSVCNIPFETFYETVFNK